jgi:hypothetical protein
MHVILADGIFYVARMLRYKYMILRYRIFPQKNFNTRTLDYVYLIEIYNRNKTKNAYLIRKYHLKGF